MIPTPIAGSAADRATRRAGHALVAIGVGHLALVLPRAVRAGHARAWLSGALVGDPRAPHRSALAFWQGPGSLAVPLVATGLATAELARSGRPLPHPVTALLAAWAGFGAAVLEPSGFPLAVVPIGLLARAAVLRHRGVR